MKTQPISTLKPGDLFHFADKISADETRISYFRVVKNRKPKISTILPGVLVVPVQAFGFMQGKKSTLRKRGARHYYVDGRYPAIKKPASSWAPKPKAKP